MSNYASLKATINANIKTNGSQEITGSVLNSVLNAMVNTLGAGYQYAGMATPSSNPGTPDTNVFYIAATAGTYTNMGGLVVSDGEVAILKYNGTWTKDVTGVATAEQVSQLQAATMGRLSFVLGQISTSTGNPTSSTTRVYSEMIPNPGVVYFEDGVKVSPRYYNADGSYVTYDEWYSSGEANLNASYPYVRIVAAYSNDGTISDASAFDSLVQAKSLDSEINGLKVSDVEILARLLRVENDLMTTIQPTFELGTIGTGNGTDEASTTRARCGKISYDSRQVITIQSGCDFAFRWYSASDAFISTSAVWLNGTKNVSDYVPANGATFRLVVRYSNNATISDASDFDGKVSIITPLPGKVEEIAEKVSSLESETSSLDERMSSLENVALDVDFVIGQIDNTGTERNDNTRVRSEYLPVAEINSVSVNSGYKYSYRWYDSGKNYIVTTLVWRTDRSVVSSLAPSNAVYFRIVGATSDDGVITDASVVKQNIIINTSLSSSIEVMNEKIDENRSDIERIEQQMGQMDIYTSTSSLGNCSILAAKQHTFSDGSAPVLEWFLLADPDNKLYISRDLHNKTYIAQFSESVGQFSFGVLPNGDIIACKMASELNSGGSDNNRVNPYVFKASENWATQHEVLFESSLKPCGWLENCGFTTLPDGNAMFAEYTRVTVATCNCWKIVGDPLVVSNWVVKKSFSLSGEPDAGFKHAHMVVVDYYTGVIYLATGDDNVGAMVFASSDGGDTWTQLREGSELWCRMLMMTFTPDYIYWAQDTPGQHYLFRAQRDSNGVLDYTTAIQYVTIPAADGYFASYGQAYLPEFNAVMLLDRQDSGDSGQTMPIRVITLDDGQIHTIGSLVATDGGNIGFRTSFSEWNPVGGVIRVGFGFVSPTINKNKVLGNQYPVNNGRNSVNNLWMRVGKDGDNWSLQIGTYYL